MPKTYLDFMEYDPKNDEVSPYDVFRHNITTTADIYVRETMKEKIAEILQAIYDGTGVHNRDDIRALERTLDILDL